MTRTESVGGLLRAERTGAGLTQSQLSDRCGIPKPTLSRYENDHVVPSLGTLKKLALALNVTETAFIPNSEEPVEHLYAALKRRGIEIRTVAEADAIAALVAQFLTAEAAQLA